MGLSPNIRFSGGHIHLPGGERHIATFTARGGFGETPYYSALPEGLYDLDPVTMEFHPEEWSSRFMRPSKGLFEVHTSTRGNGIRVSAYVRSRLIALSRQRGSRGRLLVNVNYGNKVPWMTTARKEIGTTESSGRNDGAAIKKYWSGIGYSGLNDDIDALPVITATSTSNERNKIAPAWCAGFVAWVMTKNGYSWRNEANASLSVNPALAANWAKFGRAVTQPTFGCVAVKNGHVTFVAGGNSDKLYVLGGNQANGVNVMEQKRSLYHTFRLPIGYVSTYDFLPPFKGTFVKSGSTS